MTEEDEIREKLIEESKVLIEEREKEKCRRGYFTKKLLEELRKTLAEEREIRKRIKRGYFTFLEVLKEDSEVWYVLIRVPKEIE